MNYSHQTEPVNTEEMKALLTRVSEAVKDSDYACESTITILDSMLSMEQLGDSSGHPILFRAYLPVGEILQTAVTRFQSTARRQGITISFSNDLPGTGTVDGVFVDTHHFDQVLRNIFLNAIKFTPAGGYIQVSVRRAISEQDIGEIMSTHYNVHATLKKTDVRNEERLSFSNHSATAVAPLTPPGETNTAISDPMPREFVWHRTGHIIIQITDSGAGILPESFPTVLKLC